jgi:phage protein U
MYAQLGDIVFETLKGFTAYTDKQETTYAEHALIENKPRLQRTGEKLQEINLTIDFHSAFCQPDVEMAKLQQLRLNGEILTFIWGSGDVEGDFVIKSISKKLNDLAGDGNSINITADLELIEYYNPDKPNSNKLLAKRNAFATKLTTPLPGDETVDPPSDGVAAMKDVSKTDLNANNFSKTIKTATDKANANNLIIDKAQDFVNSISRVKGLVNKMVTEINNSLSLLNVKIGANPKIVQIATTLNAAISAAGTVVTSAQNLLTSYDNLPASVTTIPQANAVLGVMATGTQVSADLINAIKDLKTAAQPLASATATRQDI